MPSVRGGAGVLSAPILYPLEEVDWENRGGSATEKSEFSDWMPYRRDRSRCLTESGGKCDRISQNRDRKEGWKTGNCSRSRNRHFYDVSKFKPSDHDLRGANNRNGSVQTYLRWVSVGWRENELLNAFPQFWSEKKCWSPPSGAMRSYSAGINLSYLVNKYCGQSWCTGDSRTEIEGMLPRVLQRLKKHFSH
jgi:hypothetical protein